LFQYYFPTVSAPFRGGYMSANKQFLSQLPIHLINFSNDKEKKVHQRIVELVDCMLKLHKDLQQEKSDRERTSLQRQIEATDAEIDDFVYQLYGITEEERKIVEESIQ
jgi:hypothetical protein